MSGGNGENDAGDGNGNVNGAAAPPDAGGRSEAPAVVEPSLIDGEGAPAAGARPSVDDADSFRLPSFRLSAAREQFARADTENMLPMSHMDLGVDLGLMASERSWRQDASRRSGDRARSHSLGRSGRGGAPDLSGRSGGSDVNRFRASSVLGMANQSARHVDGDCAVEGDFDGLFDGSEKVERSMSVVLGYAAAHSPTGGGADLGHKGNRPAGHLYRGDSLLISASQHDSHVAGNSQPEAGEMKPAPRAGATWRERLRQWAGRAAWRRSLPRHRFRPLRSAQADARKRRRGRALALAALACAGLIAGLCAGLLGGGRGGAADDEPSAATSPSVDAPPAAEAGPPWDAAAPCAPFAVRVWTDAYGNETRWELYYAEEGDGAAERDRATTAGGEGARGRSWRRSSRPREGGRRIGEWPAAGRPAVLVLEGGPYAYLDKSNATDVDDLLGGHSSAICLPRGRYRFVVRDRNGLCCRYGLGEYQLYFEGGRKVFASPGQFGAEEETVFWVTEEDLVRAEGPSSKSPAPSAAVLGGPPSAAPSGPPTEPARPIPSESKQVKKMTTLAADDLLASSGGSSHGVLFDVRVRANLTSVTIVGMDVLIEPTRPIAYEIWTKPGSWQDVPVAAAGARRDYRAGFQLVSNGTVDGQGISALAPLDGFASIEVPGDARQAFWVTLQEDGLRFQNFGPAAKLVDGGIAVASSPHLDVLYGTAVSAYPLEDADSEHFLDHRGFLGTIFYTVTEIVVDSGSIPPQGNSSVATPSFEHSPQPSLDLPSSNANGTPEISTNSSNTTVSFIANSSSDTTTTSAAPSLSSPPSSSPTALFVNSSKATSASDAPFLEYATVHLIEGSFSASKFGVSSSISGDGSLLAVGAKDANGTGAVYLYSLGSFANGNVSSTESNDVAPPAPFQILSGPVLGAEFGNSVALSRDGTRLVVGSHAENNFTGAARIYQIVNDSVSLQNTFSGQEPVGGHTGWSVAISGDGNVVAVGATKGGSEGGGSVTTYRYQDPDWIPHITSVEGDPGEVAGYSITLTFDGAGMAVGSVKAAESEQLRNAGKVAVYGLDDIVEGTAWRQRDEIFGEVKGILDGSSVATSRDGSILVIGGRGISSHCRIFQRNIDQFELLHTIRERTKRERLGSSAAVSEDGNIVACGGIGARKEDDDHDSSSSSSTGVVRLFNRSSLLEEEIWPTDLPGRESSFGSSLSLSSDGSIVSVGASSWKGLNGNSPGAVHVFYNKALQYSTR